MGAKDFSEVFGGLRSLLTPYAQQMEVIADSAGEYGLQTHWRRPKDGYPGYFGGVKVGKRYVSYHLMPVYAFPELLGASSPELRKRMQGKSCFNFGTVDDQLFTELADLTRLGYDASSTNTGCWRMLMADGDRRFKVTPALVLWALLALVAIILVAQNSSDTTVQVFGWTIQAPLFVVIVLGDAGWLGPGPVRLAGMVMASPPLRRTARTEARYGDAAERRRRTRTTLDDLPRKELDDARPPGRPTSR